MKLRAEEREVVVTYNDAERAWHVSSDSATMRGRILRLAERVGAEVERVGEGIEFTCPADTLRLTAKRRLKLSPEERDARRSRIPRKAHAAPPTTPSHYGPLEHRSVPREGLVRPARWPERAAVAALRVPVAGLSAHLQKTRPSTVRQSPRRCRDGQCSRVILALLPIVLGWEVYSMRQSAGGQTIVLSQRNAELAQMKEKLASQSNDRAQAREANNRANQIYLDVTKQRIWHIRVGANGVVRLEYQFPTAVTEATISLAP